MTHANAPVALVTTVGRLCLARLIVVDGGRFVGPPSGSSAHQQRPGSGSPSCALGTTPHRL